MVALKPGLSKVGVAMGRAWLWGNIPFSFPSLGELLEMGWRFLSVDWASTISISKCTFEL